MHLMNDGIGLPAPEVFFECCWILQPEDESIPSNCNGIQVDKDFCEVNTSCNRFDVAEKLWHWSIDESA